MPLAAAPERAVAGLWAVLDEAERARAERLRDPAARLRHVLAHGAKRRILAGYLGRPPERLRLTRGRHGKPELTPGPGPAGGPEPGALHFNLSHSGGLALLAVAAHRQVGVDVERLRDRVAVVELAARFFPERERDLVAAADPAAAPRVFAALWTRKEACVKAVGGRLFQGLDLPVAGDPAGQVVRRPGGGPGRLRLCDLPVPGRYAGAVALSGAAPYRVVRHDFVL